MENKILISDLDDTLLNDDLKIGELDKASILKYEAAGGITVLCSGRPTASILKTAKMIFCDNRTRYIISYNGGEIVEIKTGKTIFKQGLSIESAKTLCKIAHQAGITAQLYQENDFYIEKETPEAVRYSRATGLNWKEVGNLEEYITFSPLKILFHAKHSQLEKIYPELEKISSGNFHFTYSKPHYLEFIHPSVNKGTAVKKLCEHLGIKQSKCVAVGDSLNDIEMLQAAGTSIAVANAREEIKEICHYVCKSTNNENPITEVITRFFSI